MAAEADKVPKNDAEEVGLDDGDDDVLITLVSKEKNQHTITKKAAMRSQLIRTALEESGDVDNMDPINLFHVEDSIVLRVIEYLNYHTKVEPKKIEKPLTSNKLEDLVDEFDANFANVDQDTMFQTLLAANYLHVPDLLLLMCAKVASMMKGKTPEEIRTTFNIRDDYTPEEEEEVRREYKDLLE